jgi:hypothetical protein
MAPGVRSSVVLLTVWIDESTDPNDLRARFAAAAAEATCDDRESFAACGIEDICVRMRRWLEYFARGDARLATREDDESAKP